MSNLINWSELSRLLTGDRTYIRSDYKGKKFKTKIDRLRFLVDEWVEWQSKLNDFEEIDKPENNERLEQT